ncbi:hypothetical protein [Oceanibacterium hippocampi]|uniref:Uncharacterized protein n=1 Tax=Oceanibacterium hippocampi TaxID=745714 RepID=A0A1Y5U2Y8_9PROT|nr:hypothetical protein [Oceanibacterium hippocampi]SLN77298.1 hypothetical protein OCH7691_04377 [Oceanibacterium hippocampi]
MAQQPKPPFDVVIARATKINGQAVMVGQTVKASHADGSYLCGIGKAVRADSDAAKAILARIPARKTDKAAADKAAAGNPAA